MAYSEHVGLNRQLMGMRGDIKYLYNLMRKMRNFFMKQNNK